SPTAIPQSQARLPSWLIALGVSILASLALLLPFFWLGSASGHDFEFHVASWLDVAYQWKQGVLFPRWTAWTNFGFGEPRFIFYPPLSWILGAALSLILPISWVPAAFILLTQTLAGVSAFFLLRRLTANTPAYLGAAFYAANPYALLVSYVRSDFAEQLACAIFPLLLLAALRLVGPLQEEKPKLSTIPLFALPFATVWLCNAPAGVIASYSMALLFGWAALTQRSWKIALRGIAGLALGFGLAGYYLIPAAYEQRWVNIGQALSSGLLPAQNFLFTRIADVEHTWFNWISSLCAIALILLTALTAFASRRFSRGATISTGPKALWDTALLLLGSVATVMMLRLTAALWNLLPEMRFVQFPWRWMSILAVVCSCFLAAAVERRRGWMWFVLVAILSFPLGYFLTQNTWWDPDEMSTQLAAINTSTGYEGVDEYDPLGDDHLELPKHAPLTEIFPESSKNADRKPPNAKIQVEIWRTDNHKVLVEYSGPARVALRLLNYPTWQVTLNGKTVTPEKPDDLDQMLVPIEAGRSEIQVRFVRTTDQTAGNALSLFSLLLAAGLLASRKPLNAA
ncbi:MAG TPA: 6-pyruvoyl-tetrahydropterin synthase-related protein, partial [Candidatus Acidoferrales bacterium]|nr:6-pyruvoyl-tetrahydropterin synthase-related protein [Candidatus Acidoferrales bacterium]